MTYHYAIRNGSLTRRWSKTFEGKFQEVIFDATDLLYRRTWILTNDPLIAVLALKPHDARYAEDDDSVIVITRDSCSGSSRWHISELHMAARHIESDDERFILKLMRGEVDA